MECVPAEIDKEGTGDPPLADPTTRTAVLLPPAALPDPAPPRNGDWRELEPTKCLVSVSPAAMDPLCAALRGTVAEPSASSGNSRSAMGLLVLEAGAERVACARPGVAAEWACDGCDGSATWGCLGCGLTVPYLDSIKALARSSWARALAAAEVSVPAGSLAAAAPAAPGACSADFWSSPLSSCMLACAALSSAASSGAAACASLARSCFRSLCSLK